MTQVFFNSYILSSSFKELKAVSLELDRYVDSEMKSFESLQSEKLRSKYFVSAIEEKKYQDISKLFINWKEAHKLRDIFLYDEKGSRISLEDSGKLEESINLSASQIRFLKKGDLSSSCNVSMGSVMMDVTRQIRNNQGASLGFLSERKKIEFDDLNNQIEKSFLIIADNKRVFFNSMKLRKSEALKTEKIFTDQKLDQFVMTLNAEKYDFIKITPCKSFNIFVGRKNLQQEIYFSFYKKFFPFLVLFLVLTGLLFSISFYKQILKPLKDLNSKIDSKNQAQVETSITEIEAISKIVSNKISGLEEKVQESSEGRKKDINRLVASVAHELNNSLSYLGGNLEYLSHELSQEEIDTKEAIDAIKSANLGFQEIKKIVSDLKVFSSSGSISKNDFKIKKVIDRLKDKYPGLKFNGFEDENLVVVSDFERVMQVLFNLVQNAMTADKSKGQETVCLHLEVKGSDLEITVEDQSGGIDSSIEDKIFEPFFTTKKTEGGTGLGLALSKNLAQSLDGDLYLKETNTLGSKFCLLLRQSV